MLLIYLLLRPKGERLDLKIKHGWWVIVYISFLTVISYLGSFGGGTNYIPFGWDFLVLAIFSVAIFYLAKKLASKEIDITAIPGIEKYLENAGSTGEEQLNCSS